MAIGGTRFYITAKLGAIAGQSIAATGITSGTVGGSVSAVGTALGSSALAKAGGVLAATALGPVGWGVIGGAALTGGLLALIKLSDR